MGLVSLPRTRRSARRLTLPVVAAFVLGSALIGAQIPGRNVNMVSGTNLVDGDPFLQRQNEPSVAASTRNPLHLLGGANDYRTVDLPGLPDGEETGDAWLGIFKSTDGGQRWTSTLLPGYPQDANRAASPLGVYGAAADPVVRAGTNGLIYYAGLAFDRGDHGKSGVFVARFIDNNNRENGDPFAYLGTRLVATDSGETGGLLDKPWIAVDIPRGFGTCRIQTPNPEPNEPPIVQNVPAGPVYMAYSVFAGSGATLQSDIMFSSSGDCGVTWTTPQRLNGVDGSLNQGASVAVDPVTGNVYVAWRRFTRSGSPTTDAMMVTRSVNFGRKFEGPKVARRMPRGKKLGLVLEKILEHRRAGEEVEVAELSQFDQKSLAAELSFRTNAYPTIAFDDQGRLYMAWAERGFSTVRPDPVDGDAKIVMSTSTNGSSWTPAAAVAEPGAPGHQIMPSLAFAGGKLLLVYYDLREDITGLSTKQIDDRTAADATGLRHTMDIRASMGTPGAVPSFAPSVRVSDYFIGRRPNFPRPTSKIVPCSPGSTEMCEQLQFNPPNLPMFKQGTVPFVGDYIDIAPAPAFVPAGRGRWAYNTSSNAVPVFHAVWTDNRDVRPPANGNWTQYTPPTSAPRQSLIDPSQTIVCSDDGSTGSRNQNVYSARIAGGLMVGSPGNTKPLSETLQRGFVVFAQNMTADTRVFRMRVVTQPAGGHASFSQLDDSVTFLDVITPPRSTASRTLYVTSSDPKAQVNVDVSEISSVGATGTVDDGLHGIIILNADIENPTIVNADIENADIENADIENVEVTNADIENPTVRNADIENADIENADIENADIENADIENADIENADIENADIENADIENASLTDITWNVTNTGNTTAAFNVNLFLNDANISGVKLQLVLYKTYTTPAAATCDLKLRSHTVLVSNIIHPDIVDAGEGELPDPNDPSGSNGVLWLAPGETGKFTLRVLDEDLTNNVPYVNDKGETISIDPAFVPGETITPVVVPQEISTEDLAAGETEPPVITPDQSTLFFVQQPVNTVVNQPMTVKVQVRGKTGEVLPAVPVHLEIAGASLTGGDAISGDDGVAVFSVTVSPAGTGYRMMASVPGNDAYTPQLSAAFDILPPPVPSFVVINTNDSGAGSLRQALLNAESWPGADTITFAIPGEGPHVIAVSAPLPNLTATATIDATTQPGYDGKPVVEVSGAAIEGPSNGLDLLGDGIVVRGLAITRFNGWGVWVFQNHSDVVIENNTIGTDRDGDPTKGNGAGGVAMRYTNSSRIQGNVIAGNNGAGVLLESGASNQVLNNTIGMDPAGLSPVPNAGNGITIYWDATDPVIQGNLVSGNNGWGIELQSSGQQVAGTLIAGNVVGLDRHGNLVRRGEADYVTGDINYGPVQRGNLLGGIRIDESTGTIVGGTSETRNVISGNTVAGLAIAGVSTVPPLVHDNLIGTDPTGQGARGNFDGVVIHAPDVVLGGTAVSDRNIISGNISDGVVIEGTGVSVAGNFIGTDITGLKPLGNGLVEGPEGYPGCCHAGIAVMAGAADASIGGWLEGAGNLISANRTGVWVNGATGVSIIANSIGTKAGAAPEYLPNIGDGGIALYNVLDGHVSGNYIKGNNALAGIFLDNAQAVTIDWNTIVDNANSGVTLRTGNGVTIQTNTIKGNSALGIDLGWNGGTANDAGDADEGANGFQNYPTIESAVADVTAHVTHVTMRIDSSPGPYVVEVFSNSGCTGAQGQGETLLGRVTIEGGHAFETFDFPEIAAGTLLSATATAPDGSTSEFSPCVTVAGPTYVGPVGGGGGTPFSITCPAATVGTALRGRAGDDIDRTELWCSPAAGAAVMAGAVGGLGGVDYGATLTCPAGMVLTGAHGLAGTVVWGGTVVDTLGVRCTNLTTGATFTSPTVGNATPADNFTLNCPAGKKVVGIFGGQGGLLDRLGLICQ